MTTVAPACAQASEIARPRPPVAPVTSTTRSASDACSGSRGRADAIFIVGVSGIRYNFAFCCGGIAQLGERLHGMQEVSGSIPLTSTTDLVAALGLMATTALPVPIV